MMFLRPWIIELLLGERKGGNIYLLLSSIGLVMYWALLHIMFNFYLNYTW